MFDLRGILILSFFVLLTIVAFLSGFKVRRKEQEEGNNDKLSFSIFSIGVILLFFCIGIVIVLFLKA